MTMTPYYDEDGITIYHGDHREMSGLTADLILTDPPYGLGKRWGVGPPGYWRRFHSDEIGWDSGVAEGVEDLAQRANRVIIWGGNYYHLPPSRCWLLWDKVQEWSGSHAEMAWTNLDLPVRVFRLSRVEAHSQMGTKVHPTQKPLSLMSWCLALAGDGVVTVLDPFMGSGTTLRAAKDRGLRAIGIELDERYCEIAARRLGQGVLALGETG